MKIFIETNENDYMTYYELAANAIRNVSKEYGGLENLPRFKNYNLNKLFTEIAEDNIKELLLEFTNNFYTLLNNESIDFKQKIQMRKDLEIYLDDKADEQRDKYKKEDLWNASDIYIE